MAIQTIALGEEIIYWMVTVRLAKPLNSLNSIIEEE